MTTKVSSMKVKEIMSRPIISEDQDTSVVKVADNMEKLGIGSVVITNNGEPVGIITERDLVTKVILKNEIPSDFRAGEIMSSPLVTIDSEASISDASKLMSEKRIRRLPVIEEESLIGVISVRNILSEKPECVKRIYKKPHALVSAISLEKAEDAFVRVEQLLPDSEKEDFGMYNKALEEVYRTLGEIASEYEGDEEIQHIFKDLNEFCKNKEGLSISEHKERLSDILRELRHIICWRKLNTPSSFSSGLLPFTDFRGHIKSSGKLPK